MRFGVHVSIGGGLRNAAKTAETLGCETVQIFASSPSTWNFSALDAGASLFFKNRLSELKITPLVIHTAYLVNLAAPEEDVYKKSIESLRKSAERAAVLGAQYVVTHIGSHKGSGLDEGIERIAAGVHNALEAESEAVILLEGSAGSGSNIGSRFKELRMIKDAIGWAKNRTGFCLDTAHLYGAGYDIASEHGLEETLAEFDRLVGFENLKLWHFNDTKAELGSRKDRHWHIGEGRIGLEGFTRIINHSKLLHLPAILETPMEDGWDMRNLKKLRELRAKG